MLTINSKNQTLIFKGKTYQISTAKNGLGEVEGSNCTPTGRFRIAEKIGAGLGENAVLQGRIPTGEIYSQNLAKQQPERDWILTRILWLDGLEAHNQNTKSRFIYIHGAPDEASFAAPSSKGCIRMRNADIMALFDLVAVGEIVQISDEKPAAKAY